MPGRNNRKRSSGNGGNRSGTPTLKDILANNSLGDDVVIAVGDDSYTLGDLRDLHEETGGGSTDELQRREAALASSQTELISAQEELARMFQHLSTITGRTPDQLLKEGLGDLEHLGSRRRASANDDDDDQDDQDAGRGRGRGGRGGRGNRVGRDDAGRYASLASGLDEDDPILAPFIARIEKLQNGDLKALKDQVGNLQKALGIALKVNLDEYYDRVYSAYAFPSDDVMKKHKFTKPDLSAVLKYAESGGLKDKQGRWNVSKALSELTSDVRHKLDIEAAEARGRKAEQDDRRMAGITPPGAGRKGLEPGQTFKRKDGTTKDFGDVLTDAANDQELWNSAVNALGGAGGAGGAGQAA
jgi:hypothetical protein